MAKRLKKIILPLEPQQDLSDGEDRISNLPDSLIHHILSFLPIKVVASTCTLSQRWNFIWTCVGVLDFEKTIGPTSTSSERKKFMCFLEHTLLLRERGFSVQKFVLECRKYMEATRVNSCISSVVRSGVEDMYLHLCEICPRSRIIPVSLFTCESLVSLKLKETRVTNGVRFPKHIRLPKLKYMTLDEISFDSKRSNELLLMNCHVLEELILQNCTFSVRDFFVSAPSVKHFIIDNNSVRDAVTQGCAFKIHAPSVVSLDYSSHIVARDYVLSPFVAPVKAALDFFENGYGTMDQKIHQGASVRKFLEALSQVQSLSMVNPYLGPAPLSISEDMLNKLPTFHVLNRLELYHPASEEAVVALLKASPNLESLLFGLFIDDNYPDDDGEEGIHTLFECTDEVEGFDTSFRRLKSVSFEGDYVNPMEVRWIKLVLKNAPALQEMTLHYNIEGVGRQQEFMEEIHSLPRASTSCVFSFS